MSKKIDPKDRIIEWFKTAAPVEVEVMRGKIEIICQMRNDVSHAEPAKRRGRPIVKRCKTCNGSPTKGWMQIPGHDGEPCPECNSPTEAVLRNFGTKHPDILLTEEIAHG